MSAKEDYINAVLEFNKLKSFNIFLPDNDEMFNLLSHNFTKKIKDMTKNLETYEICRKKGFIDNFVSTIICGFVVHVNHITNNLKSIDEDYIREIIFEEK